MREIGLTQQLIGESAHPRRFFRPTGGDGTIGPTLLSAAAARYLIAHRYSLVLWNAVPEDWIHPDDWVGTAVRQCLSTEHSTLVLHDLPTGAMEYLGHFLDRIQDLGGTFVQEFPQSCLPLDRGVEKMPLSHYVADPEFL
jgi:peptidoglycan-N-acetylglucosamine deacetylase